MANLDAEYTAAKRDVRKYYDTDPTKYQAAESRLDALRELKRLVATRDVTALPSDWLEVLRGDEPLSRPQIVELCAWLRDCPESS